MHKSYWITKLWDEKIFTVSLILAVLTSVISFPKIDYIDFEVILCLFNLMVVAGALEELKILDSVAVWILNKCKNVRLVSLVILALTFTSSMLLTNDVALLTFVPLTLIISSKADINPMNIIIFQTLAANIGSSLTPMGNPQNLFLFTHYGITAIQFLKILSPFVLVGVLWILALNQTVTQKKFKTMLDPIQIGSKTQALLFATLFIIIIFSELILEGWEQL